MASGKRILVIEDEKDIRETLREVLEMEGYSVSTAVHGQEGLERLAKDGNTALVILDLMMPVMDGWEFLEKKSKDTAISSVPVIVLSAVGDKAIGHRVLHYFKKPVDLDQLLDKIQEQVSGGSATPQASLD